MKKKIISIFKKLAKSILFFIRYHTRHLREKPTFFIVGAQKAGTTSLFNYVRMHPRIKGSQPKEVHYFDGGLNPGNDNYLKGDNWYKAHFPLISKSVDHIGEASPSYLYCNKVAARIHSYSSNAKIIIILRTPEERAISHFLHSRRKGFEKRDMLTAFTEEKDMLLSGRSFTLGTHEYFNHSYLSRGLYAFQIQKYTEIFSHKHTLILTSNELFKNPNQTVRKTFEFLNVAHININLDLKPFNVAPNTEEVSIQSIALLQQFFLVEREALKKRYGLEFSPFRL